ncbi:MAG: hypothetical protein DRN92_02505 [Thermoproteota archaeon]|nr:MAG: hypothetical protein DRN92_02505 [Candidatus Korarchaeota archaeon]
MEYNIGQSSLTIMILSTTAFLRDRDLNGRERRSIYYPEGSLGLRLLSSSWLKEKSYFPINLF